MTANLEGYKYNDDVSIGKSTWRRSKSSKYKVCKISFLRSDAENDQESNIDEQNIGNNK
jgi:hypothetical protein